jgi:ubiquinone biosynthesis protein
MTLKPWLDPENARSRVRGVLKRDLLQIPFYLKSLRGERRRGVSVIIRVLVLAWHFSLGAFRFGFRMTLASFFRGNETRQDINGRTLVEIFEALGPTYLKLGQILSTRRDLLSEPVIRHLESLQDQVPPSSFKAVPSQFRKALGIELDQAFSEIDVSPIASASIATVYRARLRDGRVVAVKVRRPGIAECIESDLFLLRLGASLLQRIPSLRLVPLRSVIDEFSVCIVRQLDFRLEADANRRLRAALACEPDILIPGLVDELCSSSILTMDFINDLDGCTRIESELAHKALLTAVHALYRMIFVEGFIHCDMHAGNLHFLPNGRVALIDFGFMAELKDSERLKFAQFFYAMATNNGKQGAQIILETASFFPSNLISEAFEADVVALIDRVFGAKASEYQVAHFVVSLFDLQRRYHIRGTPNFTMAIISLLVLEGIVKRFDPDLDFQGEARPFILRALLRPHRATAPGTHLQHSITLDAP